MANKKRAAGSGASEGQLKRLEKQYDQLAGLLHCSNQQDEAIRKQAIAEHDRIQAQIARLQPKLRAALPEPDQQDAEEYGRLLKRRAELSATIMKIRTPATERGHKAPL
jgi:hypothetical protein